MNVGSVRECRDHCGVAGYVREQAQLDLRIVGVDQHAPRCGNEVFAQLTPFIGAYRDILKVRLGGGKSARCRSGLLELGVYAAVFISHLEETDDISAVKLGQLAVFEHVAHDLVVGGEFFEYIRICGIAGFGFLSVWQ